MKRGRYVPVWRQAEPYRESFTERIGDVYQILWQLVVLISLFVGLPFLVWLIAGMQS